MANEYFREFLKDWGDDLYPNLQNRNQILHFCYLCEEIYNNLTYIDEYDKEKFNAISIYPIESFMRVFDNMYKKFYNLVFNVPYDEQQKSFISSPLHYDAEMKFWKISKRFDVTISDLNKDKFNIENKTVLTCGQTFHSSIVTGIKDEYYDEIKTAVNKILIFERNLKFITMKDEFWKGVAKDGDDINLKNNFCICGKLLFEGGWRISGNDRDVKDFATNKIYQSASIISKNTINKLFTPDDNVNFKSKAFLVYKFDLSKVACVSFRDGFSDELINGDTKFKEMTLHTNIQKIDETLINGKKHELFAYCPVFSTLNCMLNAHSLYNEVVLTNPEPIGVIALNRYSEDFAYRIAKENHVKFLGTFPKKQTMDIDWNNL